MLGIQCPEEPQGTTTMQVQIVQHHYSTHSTVGHPCNSWASSYSEEAVHIQGRSGEAEHVGEGKGLRDRAEPRLFEMGLISKIIPTSLCPENILQGPFWSHKTDYSIKKLVKG